MLEVVAGAKEFKSGFSGMSMTPQQMKSNLKVLKSPVAVFGADSQSQLILAIIVVYKTIVTLIKLSILMIYVRLGEFFAYLPILTANEDIAVNKTFERLCKGTMCLLVIYQCIVFIVVPAQCTPLQKLWDFTGQVQGHCINSNAFYHGTHPFVPHGPQFSQAHVQ